MNITTPTRKLLTKSEVADLFAVSTRTINNWLAEKSLPYYRRGNVLRFRPDEIEVALDKMRVPAAGEPKPPKRHMTRVKLVNGEAA